MTIPCDQEAEIKGIIKRLGDGEVRFTKLESRQSKTLEVATETRDGMLLINKRLFQDNGTISHQTRLDRHEQILKVAVWLASVSVAGIFGIIVTEIAGLILKAHGGG